MKNTQNNALNNILEPNQKTKCRNKFYQNGKPHKKTHNGKRIYANWITPKGDKYCDYCWDAEKRYWGLKDNSLVTRINPQPTKQIAEIRLDNLEPNKKRCLLCLSSRTKLTNRLNVLGEIIPNEYRCVEYWGQCRKKWIENTNKKLAEIPEENKHFWAEEQ